MDSDRKITAAPDRYYDSSLFAGVPLSLKILIVGAWFTGICALPFFV